MPEPSILLRPPILRKKPAGDMPAHSPRPSHDSSVSAEFAQFDGVHLDPGQNLDTEYRSPLGEYEAADPYEGSHAYGDNPYGNDYVQNDEKDSVLMDEDEMDEDRKMDDNAGLGHMEPIREPVQDSVQEAKEGQEPAQELQEPAQELQEPAQELQEPAQELQEVQELEGVQDPVKPAQNSVQEAEVQPVQPLQPVQEELQEVQEPVQDSEMQPVQEPELVHRPFFVENESQSPPQHTPQHSQDLPLPRPPLHHITTPSVEEVSRRLEAGALSKFPPQPSTAFVPPMHQEGVVFYPAPIPVQLRLPPKLSKRGSEPPKPRRTRRHSQSRLSMPGTELVSPPSPSLSADSGMATLESDYDRDQDELSGLEDDATSIKARGKKGKWGGRKKPANPDSYEREFDSDSDDVDFEDPLAFQNYDAWKVNEASTEFYAANGPDLMGGKPMSLIEQLEARKAGRKAHAKMLRDEAKNQVRDSRASFMDYDDVKSMAAKSTGGTSRLSLHPLDQATARGQSLMELHTQAQHDYKVAVRQSQMYLSGHLGTETTENMANEPEETLAERRARLKKMRQAEAGPLPEVEGETLKQRRQRLRQRPSSLVRNSVL